MTLLPSYEIWVWIRGYEGRYEISNRGNLRFWVQVGGKQFRNGQKGVYFKFLTTPKMKKTHPNKWGYWGSSVGGSRLGDYRSVRIHREVAILFVPNPNNLPEVDHVNGVKSCNEWWNFEWVDRMESIKRAFETGLIKPAIGENQSNTKLTNDMVLLIYRHNAKYKLIAKGFGVSVATVQDIKQGRTWWHLTGHPRHIKPSEKGKYKKQ